MFDGTVGKTEPYLCSFCGRFWDAATGSIDRTREVRCISCAINTPGWWDDDMVRARLRGMTG